jgi:hypothetical protein
MPINRLLLGRMLEPEEIERLDRAFSFTLKSLSLVDRNDPICEIVARRVVEIAPCGHPRSERDRAKLAAKQLGVPN